MSYISLERSNLYVTYAFSALLSYSVSKQIYTILREIPDEETKERGINRPRRRSINYYHVMQKSAFDVIIYSALAIESFINKLGFCIYGKEYSTKKISKGKALERCSLNFKLETIVKYLYSKCFDYNAVENKSLKLLFIDRDDLVHDKPEIYDRPDFRLKKSRKIDHITPEEAFEALFQVNKLFAGYKYNDSSVRLINDIIEHDYSLFKKENELTIDANLPFCEAMFSDIYLYRYYLRNTIGYEIPVKVEGNKIIRSIA